MKRERRSEVIRFVYAYCSEAVFDLANVDGGLYENLADINTNEGQEENDLAVATVKRIAAMLDDRGVKR